MLAIFSHDHLVARQWSAAPVLGDMGEQPVLHLVPLAGARRKMVDGNGQADFVGEALQFDLPKARAWTIAAASIGGDQQLGGVGVGRTPHALPPTANTGRDEGGGIVVDADVDPAFVADQVVNTVGPHLAQFRQDEVVDAHRLRLPFGLPLTTAIFEIANQLFSESLPVKLSRVQSEAKFLQVFWMARQYESQDERLHKGSGCTECLRDRFCKRSL